MTAEVDYRDKRDELEMIFKKMLTCKDGIITTKDFPSLIREIKYNRTSEQMQAYVDYWDKNHGGRLNFETYMTIATSAYKTSELARQYAIDADIDKDGFISSNEFLGIATLMCSHDTRLAGKSFTEFVEETDTNRDGKVSIDECGAWIENQLNNSSL